MFYLVKNGLLATMFAQAIQKQRQLNRLKALIALCNTPTVRDPFFQTFLEYTYSPAQTRVIKRLCCQQKYLGIFNDHHEFYIGLVLIIFFSDTIFCYF